MEELQGILWGWVIATPLARAHSGGATEVLGQRALLFELGGGLQQKCVSDILTSIRPGRRAGLLQRLRYYGALSGCHHSVLCLALFPSSSLARIGRHFSHCLMQELLFFILFSPPPFFHPCSFLHFSSFTGSSPVFGLSLPFSLCPISFVLSNGSLGSFPAHTASRFSFHPSLHLFSLPHFSPSDTYTVH